MIELHTSPAPEGRRVSITLEEPGTPPMSCMCSRRVATRCCCRISCEQVRARIPAIIDQDVERIFDEVSLLVLEGDAAALASKVSELTSGVLGSKEGAVAQAASDSSGPGLDAPVV